jgi:hypothetical protein
LSFLGSFEEIFPNKLGSCLNFRIFLEVTNNFLLPLVAVLMVFRQTTSTQFLAVLEFGEALLSAAGHSFDS